MWATHKIIFYIQDQRLYDVWNNYSALQKVQVMCFQLRLLCAVTLERGSWVRVQTGKANSSMDRMAPGYWVRTLRKAGHKPDPEVDHIVI